MEVNRQEQNRPVFMKRAIRLGDGRELIFYDFNPDLSSNQLSSPPTPADGEGEDHV